MKKRTFITGYSLKLPGITSAENMKVALGDISRFSPEFTSIAVSGEETILIGTLSLDTNAPFFPKRSDLKVMRQDVAAAAFCAGEIMAGSGISEAEWAGIPLFIANGICVEKQEDEEHLLKMAYLASVESTSVGEKQSAIYKTIPPLLALRTLTNSSESFVAQYTGLAGSNTTFGNTSHSGFYALKEAISRIENGENHCVLVGSSHAAGTYSYLTFRNFTQGNSNWKESVCAAFLLLESEDSYQKRNASPLAEIIGAESNFTVPSLSKLTTGAPYSSLGGAGENDFCIYSGGLSEQDHEAEKTAVESNWPNSFSWYPKLGHLGSGSVLVNVATGTHFLNKKAGGQIFCVNKDPYGRESVIKISAGV